MVNKAQGVPTGRNSKQKASHPKNKVAPAPKSVTAFAPSPAPVNAPTPAPQIAPISPGPAPNPQAKPMFAKGGAVGRNINRHGTPPPSTAEVAHGTMAMQNVPYGKESNVSDTPLPTGNSGNLRTPALKRAGAAPSLPRPRR